MTLEDLSPVTPEPRRAGRPASRVLTRESITSATLTLLDTVGYEGFTIAALARHLKVAPSALYNHVESKKDVLIWVQDHLMGRVNTKAFEDRPWDEAVREWAWSYREAFAAHAPLVPVIAVMPVGGAYETLRMYEEVTRGLLRAGWPRERVISTIVAVESFIYGSAMDVSAPTNIFDPGALADDFPLFTSAVTSNSSATAERSSADDAFDVGLEALIVGLRTRLESLRSPSA
ncbi:TetR/AcrR family transcriptional regulator C-terminal domain-containing protein [Arthrobacter sp.]|uniref:TetR/AcrR family transcriptional regulator C-terminal domain-containing protein n=1 Tax=Arthrobacter sp. TaxID=1667 RepID=UPI00281198B0|nr:TetR/AcrR family transcriptional regulator C-terminal domain-containing protein [Arthrobacter sp.]